VVFDITSYTGAWCTKFSDIVAAIREHGVDMQQEVSEFTSLSEDILANPKRWQEWMELGRCEEAPLPGAQPLTCKHVVFATTKRPLPSSLLLM
jgi:hypothetical protein